MAEIIDGKKVSEHIRSQIAGGGRKIEAGNGHNSGACGSSGR